jgi:hypothetical protein
VGKSVFRLFHRASFQQFRRRRKLSRSDGPGGTVAQPLRPVGDAEGSIQVLMGGDVASCQSAAPAYLFDLQVEVLKVNGVVLVHRALAAEGENQIQIAVPAGDKGGSFLRRRPLKALVKVGDIPPSERCWLARPRRFRSASAPGTDDLARFRSCDHNIPGLCRTGREHLYVQIPQRPSYLRNMLSIHLPTRFRSKPEMASMVLVQSSVSPTIRLPDAT